MKKTSDIYFAAALIALGAELVNVDKSDPRHMQFEFSDMSSAISFDTESKIPQQYVLPLNEWETKWANGSLEGNFLKYKDAIQRLKGVVHTR